MVDLWFGCFGPLPMGGGGSNQTVARYKLMSNVRMSLRKPSRRPIRSARRNRGRNLTSIWALHLRFVTIGAPKTTGASES